MADEKASQKPDNCNYSTSFYEGIPGGQKEVFICHKRERRVSPALCKACKDWRKVNAKLFE